MIRLHTAIAGLVFATSMAIAGPNAEFQQFVLKQAHEQAFRSCDAAILNAFSNVGGQDIRATTYSIPGGENDSLKIHITYGAAGDAVQQEAEFRKLGGKCAFTLTSTVVSTKSCAAEMGANSAFRYQTETAGVIYTQNAGGVDLLLTPVGATGCILTYFRTGEA